jgi:hypothetical protein
VGVEATMMRFIGSPDIADTARWPQHPGRIVTIEAVTALAAAAGGALLLIAPDGSLLQADPAVLAGSPFTDWRVPGWLLAGFVGGGYALAAAATMTGRRWARPLTAVAGVGLIAFQACEVVWIGPHPLQAVFAAVGAYVLVTALRGVQRVADD